MNCELQDEGVYLMQIADGGGGSLPQIGDAMPQMQSIFDSMNNFAKSAMDGGFAVSPEGGDALLGAIEDFQAWVDGKGRVLDQLAQKRLLGSSAGAEVIAPFAVTVATDGQGFATQLKALQQSLNKAKEGIRKAMENYQQTEEQNRSRSNNLMA